MLNKGTGSIFLKSPVKTPNAGNIIATQFVNLVGGYTGSTPGVVALKNPRATSLPTPITLSPPIISNAEAINRFYECSGLSLLEISEIFGVSVRILHFWRNEEKNMSDLNEHIVKNLSDLCLKNSKIPKFVFRNFLISEVLGNPAVLKDIQDGKTAIWRTLAGAVSQLVQEKSSNEVSNEFYLSRLPQRPEQLLTSSVDIVENKKIKQKVRKVKKLKRYKEL